MCWIIRAINIEVLYMYRIFSSSLRNCIHGPALELFRARKLCRYSHIILFESEKHYLVSSVDTYGTCTSM